MTRPRLLDLFCGAGGAAMGYHRAGFDVVGVDIEPQPNYPFPFIQHDAIKGLWTKLGGIWAYDAIHASPPCQRRSRMTNCRPGVAATYPDLIEPTRDMLKSTGLPWVMENVAGSGLPEQGDLFGNHGLLLCGAMFGLPSYRHRLFEMSHPVTQPDHPRHLIPSARGGHMPGPGEFMSVNGHPAIGPASAALGIDWMTGEEISEAIPPAFTTHIGRELLGALGVAA